MHTYPNYTSITILLFDLKVELLNKIYVTVGKIE